MDEYQILPFRNGRNKYGGGKVVYVSHGMIAGRIKHFEEDFDESICLEFTLSKEK